MKKEQALKLKALLERVAEEYKSSNEVNADAIAPALRYKDWHSKELAAFICSVIAYGRVEHIKKSICKLLDGMGDNPHQWLLNAKESDLKRVTKNWCHRFNTEADAFHLLLLLKTIYQDHHSIERFLGITEKDTAREVIERFVVQSEALLKENKWRVKKSFWFFFPRPSLGSACKRMNLYLRWMVGRSAQDFGLWSSMPPKKLMIPLDVHILNQARSLKLTKRKQADWRTVEEVTEKLKMLDSEDPTRFDFALCHLGMNGKILKSSLLALIICFSVSCGTQIPEPDVSKIKLEPITYKENYPAQFDQLTGGEQAKLHQAIRSNDLKTAKIFFERGVSVNTLIKDSSGYATSPLHESISSNSQTVFDYLLARGAKVDFIPNQTETELLVAITDKHQLMALKLLEEGANPNRVARETMETPLMAAVRLGQIPVVQILIEKKANVNAKNKDGYTALMYGAEYSCADCIALLLEAKAMVNIKNGAGKTAIQLAKEKNHTDIQKILEK